MKAILLCAGFGTRLRPATDSIPKPLLPVLGVPIAQVIVNRMRHAGLGPFALNAHHLYREVQTFAESIFTPGQITISFELPDILGSGGALAGLKQWIGTTPSLVHSGDILTDLDLGALTRHHESSCNLVTMAVRPGHNGKDRAVWLRELASGKVELEDIAKATDRTVDDCKPYTFTSIYCFSPDLLRYLPESGPSDLITGILKAKLAGEPIGAFAHTGFFADIGTPEAYLQAQRDLLAMEPADRIQRFKTANWELQIPSILKRHFPNL
jgi:mannose-1-phosphate guanylyltransferase